MESQLFIFFTIASLLLSGVHSTIFTIKNSCPFNIWPGNLNANGSQRLPLTGFMLASGASVFIHAIQPWSGRFWGRSHCSTDSFGKFSCSTGDCGSGKIDCNGNNIIPPATLVEFTLASNGGKDFYDISLVDGFNLPISVKPLDESKGCNSTSCPTNINGVCPQDVAIQDSNGSVIACKSACLAFNQPQYCCTQSFGSPNTCQPSDYSKIFKTHCPQAYSYAFDDKSSTFSCSDGSFYEITFCP